MINVLSQQWDTSSVGAYIKAVCDSVLNTAKVEAGYIDSLVNQTNTIKFLFYTFNGTPVTGAPVYWYEQERALSGNPIVIPRSNFGEYAIDTPTSVGDLVKIMWNQAIVPAKAQLNNALAQWNRLQNNPASLSETEQNSVYNLSENLFLKLNPTASAAMKQVVADNLAKSKVTAKLPTRVALPGMQYKYQAVVDIPKAQLAFTPKYSFAKLPTPAPTANQTPGAGKKFPWGIVVGGAAAAAAFYYSNR
jgi:hypothetical protein